MTTFDIGQKVRLKEGLNDHRAHSLAISYNPGWLHEMTLYASKRTLFSVISKWGNDVYTISVLNEEEILGLKSVNVVNHWIEPEHSPFHCKCNNVYQMGCNCGAFKREQESKGLVLNPYTHFWEPKLKQITH